VQNAKNNYLGFLFFTHVTFLIYAQVQHDSWTKCKEHYFLFPQ